MSGDYDDIINLPHHVSPSRAHMPVSDRAAQFAPFAALTGYGDVIKETARQTDARLELTEDEKEELNRRLRSACLPGEKPEIAVTYFIPDKKKSGGAYHTVSGKVRRIDTDKKELVLEDKVRIALDDIVDIRLPAP